MRGSKDWGQYAAKNVVAPMHDMAELAVRLGSINTFDRRGDTVWMDNFENGILKWTATPNGNGSTVTSDITAARNGSKSAKLLTGDGPPNTAAITHTNPFLALSKVGFEISFTFNDTLGLIRLILSLRNGVNFWGAQINFDPQDNKIFYKDSSGALVEFANNIRPLEYTGTARVFNTAKLVVDFVAKEYVRFIFNENEYDLSDIALEKEDNTLAPVMTQQIFIQNQVSGNESIFVDDVIITRNEP